MAEPYEVDLAGGYHVSTDPRRLEPLPVWAFLHRQSAWARGIPYEVVVRTLEHSLNFGLLSPDEEQVGFSRVITDHGQFAYLCDVHVLADHRGRGLGRALVAAVLGHPGLQNLRRIALDTASPHFCEPFGFRSLEDPTTHLERRRAAQDLWPAPPAAVSDNTVRPLDP